MEERWSWQSFNGAWTNVTDYLEVWSWFMVYIFPLGNTSSMFIFRCFVGLLECACLFQRFFSNYRCSGLVGFCPGGLDCCFGIPLWKRLLHRVIYPQSPKPPGPKPAICLLVEHGNLAPCGLKWLSLTRGQKMMLHEDCGFCSTQSDQTNLHCCHCLEKDT